MTTTIDRHEVMGATARVCGVLNEIERRTHRAKGYTTAPDFWHISERKKFDALDCGSSGAFLVEKETGELYNIAAYGRPDYNKKRKADLGNIMTVDAEALHARRWNYLR